MTCGRCNSGNSGGARYCNACGSPLAPAAASGSPLTPHADKEFEKPIPAGLRQTSTESEVKTDPASASTGTKRRNRSGSISDGPLDLRHIPTDPPARVVRTPPPAVLAAPWQWALAIASGALFLYNAGFAIVAGLFWLRDHSAALSLTSRFGVYAILAAGACCGLAVALPDAKTSLTTIFGGLLIRSLLVISILTAAGRAGPLAWLGLCGISAGVLWWQWLDQPRQPGDAARMSMALTVLVSAEVLSAGYGYASHPATLPMRQWAVLAIVIGSLLGLRAWIPGAINGRR